MYVPAAATARSSSASASVQSGITLPVPGSSAATPRPPSTASWKRISPGARQKSARTEAFLSGVRLRAPSPEAGTTQMSPPVDPSSLMRPWMTAIDLPSGEKRGQAIWRGGSQIARAAPESAATR